MRSEEGSDPHGAWTAVVGVIVAVIVFAIIVALQTLYNRVNESERQTKIYSTVYEDLVRVRAEQLENLNSYRWIDEVNGVVGVPIERAMELVVQDRGRSGTGAPAAPAVPGESAAPSGRTGGATEPAGSATDEGHSGH